MARYFKYNPQQYESMFVPLPLDLFAAKLQGEQGKFDALEQASQQVQDQWRSLQVDPYDVEKRDKKIAEMKQEFSDVIDKSKGDVNQMYSELNRLNRDWNEYITMGHGAAMTQSLAQVTVMKEKADKARSEGKIGEATYWTNAINNYRRWGAAGGTSKDKEGKYNVFGFQEASPDWNQKDWHTRAMTGWNASSYSKMTGDGTYKYSYSYEALPYDKVANALRDDLDADEDFQRTTQNEFRYQTQNMSFDDMYKNTVGNLTSQLNAIDARLSSGKLKPEQEKYYNDQKQNIQNMLDGFNASGAQQYNTSGKPTQELIDYTNNLSYELYRVDKREKEVDFAATKLAYEKEKVSDIILSAETEAGLVKYAYDLENKAKPAMSVNTSTKDTGDALNMFKDFYEQAQADKEGAYKNIINAGLQLVKDKKLSEQDLTNIYNATLAKMPEGSTYADTIIEMARETVSSKSVDEYNKANGTNLDADTYARWKADAVTDVINYQVGQVKEYAVNNFISTTMDNVMTDDMLNVVEYAVRNNPDTWEMLGKANIPSELAGKDWGSMSKDEQKSALKALAGANPTDFLTIYANGGGDINGLVQVMYGQAVTAADGPIADLNKEYTTAFANMTEQQLSDMGVLDGLDEIYKPSEGGKVKSATFVKNPLGFGTGFVELTIADKEGNTTKKVVDVSKNTDAANIALHYWSNQLNDWSSNPDAASNTSIQQQIDKARAIRGSLITNNTLSPVVGDRGMTQVAKSNITGKQYKVVPVKFMGKTEYQLYEIVAGTEKPMINRYSKNSYENIEAVNAQISDYEWEDDYTGANPTGQKKVIKDQNQEPEN